MRVLHQELARNEALVRASRARALALRKIEKIKFQQQLSRKDNEIATLQQKLSDTERKIDMVNLKSELKQVQIDQEIPRLQRRVKQLETLLVEPSPSPSSSMSTNALCERLKADLRRANGERDECWAQANQAVVNAALETLEGDQSAIGVRVDMEAAAEYLGERHRLRAENEALKERFSHELLADPLRVRALERSEEDLAEEAELKKKVEAHFGITYGLKPKVNNTTVVQKWEDC